MVSQNNSGSQSSKPLGLEQNLSTKYSIWNMKKNKIWLACGILVACLLATWISAIYIKQEIELHAKQEFDFVCTEIKDKIITRLSAHAQLLRSGAAFLESSVNATRKEWRSFIEHQRVEKKLPGIQGIGYSIIISARQLAQHEQKIRKEGFPRYAVKPAGKRKLYTSIIYLEPFSGRNVRAFGYDMFSEPVRRKAMEYARDYSIS